MGTKRIIKKISKKSILIESFTLETDILKNLKHKSIPVIYDIEETEAYFYIIEEHIEGHNLYDVISEKGVFSEEAIIDYGIDIANVLKDLHGYEKGSIFHLDIQPNNIIVRDKRIYIIDFGSGYFFGSKSRNTVYGTKGFTAPERYKEDWCYTEENCIRADIFGLGAVLLYMASGYNPELSISKKIFKEYELSFQLIQIIKKMIYSEKESGFKNVKDIINELKKLKVKNTKDQCLEDDSQFIISVAGSQNRVGTTTIALNIVKNLIDKGIPAMYEEDNQNNGVRDMIIHNEDILYHQGLYYLDGICIKPDYGKNILISKECSVVVKDEGVMEKGKKYYGLFLLVGGIKGSEVDNTLSKVEMIPREREDISNRYLLLNMTTQEKALSFILKKGIDIPWFSVGWDKCQYFINEELMSEIVDKIYQREVLFSKEKKSNRNKAAKGNRYNFWKKR